MSADRLALAKAPSLADQAVGMVQFAGPLGRLAHLNRGSTRTGLLVRVVLAEQAPIGPLDGLRLAVCTHSEQPQCMLVCSAGVARRALPSTAMLIQCRHGH